MLQLGGSVDFGETSEKCCVVYVQSFEHDFKFENMFHEIVNIFSEIMVKSILNHLYSQSNLTWVYVF